MWTGDFTDVTAHPMLRAPADSSIVYLANMVEPFVTPELWSLEIGDHGSKVSVMQALLFTQRTWYLQKKRSSQSAGHW